MDKQLVQMAVDAYYGRTANFSKDEVNSTIREQLITLNGGSEKITDKSFRRHPELFDFLEETLRVLVVDGLTSEFDGFAEVRDVDAGDKPVFHIPNNDLFRVATISDGNGNIRRQRIDNGEVVVDTVFRAIKVYEELSRIMAGRIDWGDFIDRVNRSYQRKISTEVYEAIYNSFDVLNATYKVTTNDPDAITEMAMHVEAATDSPVALYGTKAALAKVKPSELSQNMMDRKNETGFIGIFNGYEMREIKQVHKAGTNDFAISNDFILAVPTLDEGIVKIVNEGEARIQENIGLDNADMSQEYLFAMKTGISVATANAYGIVQFT